MEQYLIVDSNLRDQTLYPTGNNYTVHLTNPMSSVKRIELVQAIVPNEILNVKSGANCIDIDGYVFSIPPGAYKEQELVGAIQGAIYNLTSIEVSFNSSQKAFIFLRLSSDSRGSFTMTFSDEISKLLGFESGTGYTSASVADTSVAGTVPLFSSHETYSGYDFIRSAKFADTRLESFIYLDVDEFNNGKTQSAQKIDSNTFSTSGSQRTFCPIPLNVASGSVKVFQEGTDYRFGVDFEPPIQQLSRLTIKWKRGDGEIVNFRDINENSFVLRVFTNVNRLPNDLLEEIKEEENDDMFRDPWSVPPPNPTVYMFPETSRLGD